MLRPFLFLLILSPIVLHAQEEDRDRFAAFRDSMLLEMPTDTAPAPPEAYILVWQEHCEGSFPPTLIAGLGSTTLKDRLNEAPQGPFGLYGSVTYYGDRYAYLSVELPTGLPRFTHWYFVRRK